MEDLYLPPRSRKTLQKVNQGERKDEKSKKDESDDGSSFDGSDEDQPRKRGRPRVGTKEVVKGFTDAEVCIIFFRTFVITFIIVVIYFYYSQIRKFIKSCKRFPNPLKRIDAVAGDADLQEKPKSELKKLVQMLYDRCHEACNNENTEKEFDPTNEDGPKKKNRGPSIKLGGVAVNAKSVLACSEELDVLDDIVPPGEEERSKWILDLKRVKSANFDFDWDITDDSKLLVGISLYGLGSWEAMKIDTGLGLSDKILSNEDKKPQAKHLLARAEYLLKMLKKNQVVIKGESKPRKARKSKEGKSREIIDDDSTDNENGNKKKAVESGANQEEKSKVKKDINNVKSSSTGSPKKEKKRKVTTKTGPMHFTANSEPKAVNVDDIVELPDDIFLEVKFRLFSYF